MLLQLRFSARIATSSPRQRYLSVGRFLEQGPDIHMDHSELQDNSWLNYELAVKEFLRDRSSTFLNKPLDRLWMEEPYQDADTSRESWTAVSVGLKNRINLLIGVSMGLMMQCCLHVLFWVGHITAALGFVLVANTSGSGGSPSAAL